MRSAPKIMDRRLASASMKTWPNFRNKIPASLKSSQTFARGSNDDRFAEGCALDVRWAAVALFHWKEFNIAQISVHPSVYSSRKKSPENRGESAFRVSWFPPYLIVRTVPICAHARDWISPFFLQLRHFWKFHVLPSLHLAPLSSFPLLFMHVCAKVFPAFSLLASKFCALMAALWSSSPSSPVFFWAFCMGHRVILPVRIFHFLNALCDTIPSFLHHSEELFAHLLASAEVISGRALKISSSFWGERTFQRNWLLPALQPDAFFPSALIRFSFLQPLFHVFCSPVCRMPICWCRLSYFACCNGKNVPLHTKNMKHRMWKRD